MRFSAFFAAIYLTPFVSGQVTVPVTNPNWYFSPYSTYSDGAGTLQPNNILPGSTRAIWTTPGAYFKVAFTGTSFAMTVDESNITAGGGPQIEWSLDAGPWLGYMMAPPAETHWVFASGLATGTHTLIMMLKTSNYYVDRWVNNPPTQAVQMISAQVDTGAALVPLTGPQVLRPNRILFFGDSITEGILTTAGSADALQSWTHSVAIAINSEYGNLGHGGLGWLVGAPDGTPPQGASYGDYFNGHSRMIAGQFSPMPSAVVINQGTNDSANDTLPTILTFLANLRTAISPTTPVYLLVPFGQFQSANTIAAFQQCGDTYIFLVNLGITASYGLNVSGGAQPTFASFDGLHPDSVADAWIGAQVVHEIMLGRRLSH